MDYMDTFKRLERLPDIEKENEILRRRIAELESGKSPTLESEIINAFRQSEVYRQLETTAFMSFLQDRFLTDFQQSRQGKQLMTDVQEQFKIFEKEYVNHAQGNRSNSRAIRRADSEETVG